MGTGQLREGDADLLHGIVEDARHDDPGPAFPWILFSGLQRLVPCDVEVSYQVHDYRRRESLFAQGVEDGVPFAGGFDADPSVELFWRLWWSTTCSWPQRSGDLRSVLHSGDFFPTDQARRDDPVNAQLFADLTGELQVSLPAPPGEARHFVFFRSCGTPFTERDRQVMQLLRPHLYEMALDAERRRVGVPRLSPREWELLALAGAGLSNAEVAAALWISVGTVRKHMEHIREKLQVHTIAAAAAKALPHAPGRTGALLSRAR